MSDRKYRQRGYQDEPREPRREQTPAQKKEYTPRGQPPDRPKTFNMPGFREAVRCARCGQRADGGHRVEPRRHVRAVRGGPAHLRPVRALRYRAPPTSVSVRSACGSRRRTPRTRARSSSRRPRSSARPSPRRRPAPGRRSTICSSEPPRLCHRRWAYLGRALIEALVHRGHHVRALVRLGSDSRVPLGAERVTGNAL